MAIENDKPIKKKKKPFSIFISMGSYFKGAWTELKQVHWPDRKSAWGMTMAVILFTAFFVALIVVLDIVFKQLFELILK
ncbi:MAG TPA: preprotein translocase subunit SecE [Candidatus Angelobacter sp.]|nr:preprotein translocase subunit SecE [Candidatus Angelobacter sp.]